MKRFIWISLVILLAAGCGSRKKNVQQESTRAETEATASGSANVSVKNSAFGEMTLADFLENRSLKITANGAPYSLQYGGMVLSGAADLEFSESKQEKKVLYRYVTETIYKSVTTYKSYINYKTDTRYRTVDTQRAGLSFGSVIWIVIASMIGGVVLWTVLKSYLPKWRINLFNK